MSMSYVTIQAIEQALLDKANATYNQCETNVFWRHHLQEFKKSLAPRLSISAWGVSRMGDNNQALLVSMRGRPTDDDLRELHELIRENAP